MRTALALGHNGADSGRSGGGDGYPFRWRGGGAWGDFLDRSGGRLVLRTETQHPKKAASYLATQPVKLTSFRLLFPIAFANDSWHRLKVGNGPAVAEDRPPDVPDEVQ